MDSASALFLLYTNKQPSPSPLSWPRQLPTQPLQQQQLFSSGVHPALLDVHPSWPHFKKRSSEGFVARLV